MIVYLQGQWMFGQLQGLGGEKRKSSREREASVGRERKEGKGEY